MVTSNLFNLLNPFKLAPYVFFGNKMLFPTEIAPALVENDLCKSVGKTRPLGGGSINNSYSVETDRGMLFVKVNMALDSADMFAAENESLLALSAVVPNFTPKPLLHSPFPGRDDGSAFLVTEFVPLASRSGAAAMQRELAKRVARLHETESPTGMFGFHTDTMCGSTRQENGWTSSWEEFFREKRLKALVRLCVQKWGPDDEVEKLMERICDKVVPVLVGRLKGVRPVLLHGDLWSGNWGVNSDTGEPVIYDPSSYYVCPFFLFKIRFVALEQSLRLLIIIRARQK
ncbi:LOW QUALITY PROTEIN: Fructosamine kinase-domain-containing protein [Jimgerdemannia flammicorona]|uniref:protein-ribulosamine 3-kinase n=1 Tax=Jimgerdemannia flammicorona TaxID=994334 RepID=A0A433DMK0_9FUNG|nr:LOW QUALITY PROTEIN: Fructosamine kinase-domain-containing protein [Jimgerdemannia flammicorona]